MIAVLSGGVGAARLLSGLVEEVDPAEVTAIVNTGDDLTWNTLHVSPDLDTVTYSLAGADAPTGWGLVGESWTTLDALARYGAPTWFQIGDRDLATHLFRSTGLSSGLGLDEVTRRVTEAWGVRVRVLPMTNDPVRTMLTLRTGEEVDFQEYFVHRRHEVEVASVHFAGIEEARLAPGVTDVLECADGIVIAPSNPIVSIGPILAMPGCSELLADRRDHVVAVSPIVDGKALKGPADRLLRELGHESSATGVARLLAPLCRTIVIDELDRAEQAEIEALGMECLVVDTVMRDHATRRGLARTVLGALFIGRESGASPS